MSDVLIIGGGQAGSMVAINLRKQKFEGSISIITEEASYPYQRPPLSKGFLTGKTKTESLFFKGEDYYEKNGIKVLLNHRAIKLNTKKQEVTLEDGSSIGYEKLIITTGSKLNQITQKENKRIIYLNTLSKAIDLQKQLNKSKSVGVVGAGYIGLEVAATAKKMGLKTIVFEAEKRIMQRSASKEISNFIKSYHEKMGVEFKLNTIAERIDPTDKGVGISLSDGNSANPDFVVIGVGVQPASSIAEEAGIDCSNGILVDENCQTSDENVYAAGDCANHYFSKYGFRQRLESVQNAIDQAKTVSSSILGTPIAYDSVPWFWSDQYDLKLKIVGLSQESDLIVIRGKMDDLKFSACHFKENKLIALECVNDQKTFMAGKKLIEASSMITPEAIINEQSNLKHWL